MRKKSQRLGLVGSVFCRQGNWQIGMGAAGNETSQTPGKTDGWTIDIRGFPFQDQPFFGYKTGSLQIHADLFYIYYRFHHHSTLHHALLRHIHRALAISRSERHTSQTSWKARVARGQGSM